MAIKKVWTTVTGTTTISNTTIRRRGFATKRRRHTSKVTRCFAIRNLVDKLEEAQNLGGGPRMSLFGAYADLHFSYEDIETRTIREDYNIESGAKQGRG